MRTPRQAAEAAKAVARVRLTNAQYHLDEVRRRFGNMGPEYGIALVVHAEARRAFVAACDALIPIYAEGPS